MVGERDIELPQPGLGPLHHTAPGGSPSADLDAELQRLRQRFALYERLDRQIQELIARSADLLRGAVEMRQRANRELAESIIACERLIAAERAHHTAVLASTIDELATTHDHAERLSSALGDLQSQIARVSAQPAPPEPQSDLIPSPPAGSTTYRPAGAPSAPRAPTATRPSADRLMRSPADAIAIANARPTTLAPFTDESSRPHPHAERGVSMLVLAQHVPDVATALSLQRFVSGLDAVTSITMREYAARELRLQLSLTRPLTMDDLQTWDDGALEPVRALADALIVRVQSSTAD